MNAQVRDNVPILGARGALAALQQLPRLVAGDRPDHRERARPPRTGPLKSPSVYVAPLRPCECARATLLLYTDGPTEAHTEVVPHRFDDGALLAIGAGMRSGQA
ncbi:hypothetical protein ABGB19_17145 [Mycobacterium sp. B14F4]|uniref:hypothetical protein n=1 Tax=Mycobacterium sp. B14F4 TaxID=3153565 RepID=UPI00325EEFAF